MDSVITIIDVPLLKSTDEGLMERLKNFKTLAYPEIDRKRGFEEILNSPIYKDYVISEDGKTSGIVVYIKQDEKLLEFIKTKNYYLNKISNDSLVCLMRRRQAIKVFLKEYDKYKKIYNTKIIKIFYKSEKLLKTT